MLEFRTYAHILLRRWWLILTLAIVAAGVAYGYALRATPIYRATAHLSVTPS
ncbi:MAG: Wzz/FepE/Etk N-terminal domain-containing protein, partial [Chloroflexota bacterium]